MKWVLVFVWVAALLGTAFGEEPAPRPSPKRLGVLVLEGDRRELEPSRDIVGVLREETARPPGWEVVTGRGVFRQQVIRGLSPEELRDLAAFPELLGESSRAREFLWVDALLVIREESEEEPGTPSTAVLYRYFPAVPSPPRVLPVSSDEDLEELVRRAMAHAREALSPGTGASPDKRKERLLLNPESKLFHKEGVEHLSQHVTYQPADSREAARRNGYSPCAICFPEEHRLVKRNRTEEALGQEAAGAIERLYRVSRKPALADRVTRIGERLVGAAGLDRRYRFIFTALNTDEVNAFAAPAGGIYITEGMLDILESDDEIAFVLAHEIAHVARQHTLKDYRSAQTARWFGILISVATRTNVLGAVDALALLGLRGRSRGHEMEADHLAVTYAHAAGFAPDRYVLVLQKLKEFDAQHPSRLPGWLRTHPPVKDRLSEIGGMVERLMGWMALFSRLQPDDPGLALAGRRHLPAYLPRLDEGKRFVAAYQAMAAHLPPPTRFEPLGVPAGAVRQAPEGTSPGE